MNNRFLTEKKTPVLDLANTMMVNRDEDLCVLSAHKPRTINLLQLALMLSLTCSSSIMAHAAGVVTSSGDVSPEPSSSTSSWDISSQNLIVGQTTDGSLSISDGGSVTDNKASIGRYVTSSGTATVSGTGSTWVNKNNLNVGLHGTGELTISDGATVTDLNSMIGAGLHSDGTALVTGNDSTLLSSADLNLGYKGTGTLNIEKGAKVTNVGAFIGVYADSNGTASLSGTGTLWDSSGILDVGEDGEAYLKVDSGAVVRSVSTELAKNSGSTGQITLTETQGAFGTLETGQVSAGAGDASTIFDGGMLKLTADQLKLFDGFAANSVSLADGGAIIDTNGFKVASNQGLTGSGDLTKTGDGTLILHGGGVTNTAGNLLVNQGTLGVLGGARVNDHTGVIDGDTAASAKVVVAGDSSELNNTDQLIVADQGEGHLTVSHAGAVTDADAVIGETAGSKGYAAVTGTNSSWDNTNQLIVAAQGEGHLVVRDAGKVSDNSAVIGETAGSKGYATVTGKDSSWDNTNQLTVGAQGEGHLVVRDGGKATDDSAVIGEVAGSTGTAVVTGSDSEWVSDNNLNVGLHGTGRLTVSEGGTVSDSIAIIGHAAGSTGTATVSGSDSKWDSTHKLTVADLGEGHLFVKDAGTVSDSNAVIGQAAVSNGYAAVTGTNSSWDTTNQLTVGAHGTGDLTVSESGTVSDNNAVIGEDAGSKGTATVMGTNSSWDNTNQLTVGAQGEGHLFVKNGGAVTDNTTIIGHGLDSIGKMNVETGGTVTDNNAVIGQLSGSKGTATVSGAGAGWDNTNQLTVGAHGTGDLIVSDGGKVSDSNAVIGQASLSIGSAKVSGSDSLWKNNNHLTVGAHGTGDLTVSDGGTVSDKNAVIGQQSDSKGTATVTGSDSLWKNTNHLTVGAQGEGDLTVSDGGTVSDKNAVIGQQSDSKGTATVTGSGSKWNSSIELKVGDNGEGSLTVSKGGAVTDTFTIIGDGLGSNGEMNVETGGTVTDTSAVIGLLTGSAGSATVTGDGSEWNNTGQLILGAKGTASLAITKGGSVSDSYAAMGYDAGSISTATVSGDGSEWISGNKLDVGVNGEATLDVETGAVVMSGTTQVAQNSGSSGGIGLTGTLETGQVSAGAGVASFNFNGGKLSLTADQAELFKGFDAGSVAIGAAGATIDTNSHQVASSYGLTGTGNLTKTGEGIFTLNGGGVTDTSADVLVEQGTLALNDAIVDDHNGIIGDAINSSATVTLTGSGSQWNSSHNLNVGNYGSGSLDATSGGVVTAKSIFIGHQSGSDGKVTLVGTDTQLLSDDTLHVGVHGTANLNVNNGAYVSADAVKVAEDSSSSGDIKLTGSVLETAQVSAGNGTASMNFDGATLKSTANQSDLFAGFATGEVTVVNGGATFDTQSHDVTTQIGLVGTGDLTKTGKGTFNLEGGATDLGDGDVNANQGSLVIADGATVSDSNAVIGQLSGSEGTATVTGKDSIWDNTNQLTVGAYGDATLAVEADALVKAGTTQVAQNSGSSGGIGLSGTLETGQVSAGAGVARFNFNGGKLSLTADQAELFKGFDAGSVAIGAAGATIDTNSFQVASSYGLTGTGNLTKTGEGTFTFNGGVTDTSADVLVDQGTLEIADAIVDDKNGVIGDAINSSATVTLTGSGSQWNSSHNLNVGKSGNGSLDVNNGAVVTANSIFIGHQLGSDGTVTLADSGSQMLSDKTLHVGGHGIAQLNVNDGAYVRANAVSVAEDSSSSGDVTFTNSTLETAQVSAGNGTASMSFNGGKLLLAADQTELFKGFQAGSVTIGDAGATFDTQSHDVTTQIGLVGTGNLTKTGQGTFTLNGGGVTDTSADVLVEQGTLALNDAIVDDHNGIIGDAINSSASVTLTGSGSEWVNNNNLNVGVYGTAHLNVNDGAYVSAEAVKVAENNGSSGTIDLYGTLETGQVSAGDGDASFAFNGGKLVLTQTQSTLFQGFADGSVTIGAAGAWVDTNGSNVTTHANIAGTGDFTKQGAGTFTLNGDDFSDYSGELFVDQGTLVVNNHATFSDGLADIGDVAGDSAEFDLTGSDWNSTGEVIIGDAGDATMNITDSKVEDGSAVIGQQADSSDTVTVNNSVWNTTGQMVVGESGDVIMNIINGSTVEDDSAVIGHQADSVDTITLNNSDWNTDNQFIIGDAGHVTMSITDSKVEDDSAVIAQKATSNSTVTVDNSDWNTTQQMIVGDAGVVTMNITDSTVEDGSAVIAQQADSTSTVSVDGSKWNTTGQMIVGDAGDATLTINANATVEDDSTVIANQSDSNSSLKLDGTLTTTQVAAGAGKASLNFNGGNLELTANESQLFNNIDSINVASGGAFINIQNYAVASAANMSGEGGLDKQGTGELTLSGDDYSGLKGQSVIEQGTLNFDQTFDLGGSLIVMAGSTLSHEFGGTIEGNLVNSGAIYWVNLGQTTNVAGDYTATPGSTLSFETYLGGDSSATDRMAVTGGTSGTTAVTIRPIAGSPGAKTNVGISVIGVHGTSAGSFTLANTLKAGAFQYFLKHGGDGGNAGDWYLVSRYRDGVAGYVASQAINAEQGFASVSTYHQRRGGNIATDSDGRQSWLRTYGSRYSADGSDFASYDAHFYGFGLGQDLWVGQTNTGTQSRLALTADFSHAKADLSNRNHNAGDMRGQTWSLGLDYSRLAASGTYLDVVGKVAHISNDFGIVDTGSAKQDGLRGTLSLETGIPVDLGGNWQIEPQAQLIYMHTRYDGFTDSVSDLPSYTADAVRGRIGARISTHALSDDNSQSDLYGIVNVIHDFTNGSSMNINGSKVSDDFGFSGYDVGLGGAYTVSDSTALYAQTVYRKAFDGNADGVSAYVGVKVKF